MSTAMIARVLWLRRRLQGHERWSWAQLQQHQQRELARLRHRAASRSPFYQRFHHGLQDRPLAELPVLTKAMLLEHFDQITTDRTLRGGPGGLPGPPGR